MVTVDGELGEKGRNSEIARVLQGGEEAWEGAGGVLEEIGRGSVQRGEWKAQMESGLNFLAAYDGGALFRYMCMFVEENEVLFYLCAVSKMCRIALQKYPLRLDKVLKNQGPMQLRKLGEPGALQFFTKWRVTGIDLDFDGQGLDGLLRYPMLTLRDFEHIGAYNISLGPSTNVLEMSYILDECPQITSLAMEFTGRNELSEKNSLELVSVLQDRLGRYSTRFSTNLLSLRGAHQRILRHAWICGAYEHRFNRPVVLAALNAVVPPMGQHRNDKGEPNRILWGDTREEHANELTRRLNATLEIALSHAANGPGSVEALLRALHIVLLHVKQEEIIAMRRDIPLDMSKLDPVFEVDPIDCSGSTSGAVILENSFSSSSCDSQARPGSMKMVRHHSSFSSASSPRGGGNQSTNNNPANIGKEKTTTTTTTSRRREKLTVITSPTALGSPTISLMSPGSFDSSHYHTVSTTLSLSPLSSSSTSRSSGTRKFRRITKTSLNALPSYLESKSFTKQLLRRAWRLLGRRLMDDSPEGFFASLKMLGPKIITRNLTEPLLFVFGEVFLEGSIQSSSVRYVCSNMIEMITVNQKLCRLVGMSHLVDLLIDLLQPKRREIVLRSISGTSLDDEEWESSSSKSSSLLASSERPEQSNDLLLDEDDEDNNMNARRESRIIVFEVAAVVCELLYVLRQDVHRRQNIVPVLAVLASRGDRILRGDEEALREQLGYYRGAISAQDVMNVVLRTVNTSCELMCGLLEIDSGLEEPVLTRQARTVAHVLDIGRNWVTGTRDEILDMSFVIADCVMYLYKESPASVGNMTGLMVFLFDIVPKLPADCLLEAVEFGSTLALKDTSYAQSFVDMSLYLVMELSSSWSTYVTISTNVFNALPSVVCTEQQFVNAHRCALFVLKDYGSHKNMVLVQAALATIRRLGTRFFKQLSPSTRKTVNVPASETFHGLLKCLDQPFPEKRELEHVERIRSSMANIQVTYSM